MAVGQPKHKQREFLRREMDQKRLELWLYKWVHHQENVPAHSVLLEKQFLIPRENHNNG